MSQVGHKEQRSFPRRARGLVAALSVAFVTAAVAGEPVVVMTGPPSDRVEVRNVALGADGVHALVVNRSGDRLEDLTLRVSYQWQWADEFHPGIDNPSFSDTLQLDAPLAAGEAREVHYVPRAPLPIRSDGEYTASLTVESFTAFPGR